jgi:hypothetical protein
MPSSVTVVDDVVMVVEAAVVDRCSFNFFWCLLHFVVFPEFF